MKKLYLFIFIFGTVGCKSTPAEIEPYTIDEIIPALDEKNNLLFNSLPLNVARKSVTRKDYGGQDEC